MAFKKNHFLLFVFVSCCIACQQPQPAAEKETEKIEIPAIDINSLPKFNADSAYSFIAQQVSFGPRTPNSDGHKKCRRQFNR